MLEFDRTQTLGPRATDDEVANTARATPIGATDQQIDAEGSTLASEPVGGDARYELLAEHGRGGLGRVVRARDRRLGRLVAVKELLRKSALAETMFVREAMITARLEHPGIVPVHEAGRWANGDPFYVMKLVSGRTLKEVMADATTLGERLAILPHVIAVADAVGYAHSESIVHRDLKPTNVLVGEFGETVVIDWGLARDIRTVEPSPLHDTVPVDGAAPVAPATVTGRVVGTPQYMSPEQARGDAVGPAGDVYALGAIMYELLAGRPAVVGDSVKALLAQVMTGSPPLLSTVAPGVPVDLEAIVTKAMRASARDRYPTSRELAADLKRFHTGQLVTAQRYGRWRLVRRWLARYRGYVAIAGVALLAIAAVAAVMVLRVVDERHVAEQQRSRAELARAAAEAGEQQLILAQARAALATDPTTVVAWLKRYAITPGAASTIRALVDEADAAGVARHIWPLADRPRGLVLTHDGSHVAIGRGDGYLSIYDTTTGAVRRVGDGAAPITALAQAPTGGDVIVADARGRLSAIDPASGRREQLGTVAASVIGLEMLRDDWLLVQTPTDVLRRDPRTGQLQSLFPDVSPTDRLAVAWDRVHGDTRIAHGGDGVVRLWRGSQPMTVAANVPGVPTAVSVTDDGTVALVATSERIYRVDLVTHAVASVVQLTADVNQIVLDPQQRRAAVVGKGRDVYLIDVATGAVDVKPGHTDGVYTAAFDGRGERLVTASDDATVRVWDLTTGDVRELRGHRDDVDAAMISSDGHTILSTSFDNTMRLWRLDDRRTDVVGHLDDAHDLAPIGGDRVRVLSRGDGVRVVDVDLVTHSADVRWHDPGAVTGWNFLTADGATALMMHSPSEFAMWHDGSNRLLRFSHKVLSARVTRDGRTIIGVDVDGAVWREDERGIASLATVMAGGYATVDRDGRQVLLQDRVGFRVIDLETGALRAGLARTDLGLTDTAVAAFVPDDTRVAITGNPNSDVGMRVWDPSAGTIVSLVDSWFGHLPLIASPDRRWLATGVDARAVRLWDATTGQVRTTLRGHRDGVFGLAFSPDGTRLATASYDRTVRVWDLTTFDSRVLSGHVGPVWTVAWMGDDHVVSSSSDGTVRRWAVPPLPPVDGRQVHQQLLSLTTVVIGDDHAAMSP
jgi:eukaryotic-like serine/threonine-protein kinase